MFDFVEKFVCCDYCFWFFWKCFFECWECVYFCFYVFDVCFLSCLVCVDWWEILFKFGRDFGVVVGFGFGGNGSGYKGEGNNGECEWMDVGMYGLYCSGNCVFV